MKNIFFVINFFKKNNVCIDYCLPIFVLFIVIVLVVVIVVAVVLWF